MDDPFVEAAKRTNENPTSDPFVKAAQQRQASDPFVKATQKGPSDPFIKAAQQSSTVSNIFQRDAEYVRYPLLLHQIRVLGSARYSQK